MRIANIEIGSGCPPFVIAETSLNHNGDLGRALDMIHVAKHAGADCIKFQTFTASGVCDEQQTYTYRSQGQQVTEPRINIFRRSELPLSAWFQIKEECDRVGIIFMSTPQNPSDLDILLGVGIPAIKIGSDDLTNEKMIRYAARDDVALPLILSTGMADIFDIQNAVRIAGACGVQELGLLACTSRYPCPESEANVARVETLNAMFPGCVVGYSDHTKGHLAAVAAVALGAKIIECHFTLSHMLPGPDHEWAKNPQELSLYISAIREGYAACGSGLFELSDAERLNKKRYQRTEPA